MPSTAWRKSRRRSSRNDRGREAIALSQNGADPMTLPFIYWRPAIGYGATRDHQGIGSLPVLAIA